jgi:hypothetical protein
MYRAAIVALVVLHHGSWVTCPILVTHRHVYRGAQSRAELGQKVVLV